MKNLMIAISLLMSIFGNIQLAQADGQPKTSTVPHIPSANEYPMGPLYSNGTGVPTDRFVGTLNHIWAHSLANSEGITDTVFMSHTIEYFNSEFLGSDGKAGHSWSADLTNTFTLSGSLLPATTVVIGDFSWTMSATVTETSQILLLKCAQDGLNPCFALITGQSDVVMKASGMALNLDHILNPALSFDWWSDRNLSFITQYAPTQTVSSTYSVSLDSPTEFAVAAEVSTTKPVTFWHYYNGVIRSDKWPVVWNFGDGTVITATEIVSHAYQYTGTFYVSAEIAGIPESFMLTNVNVSGKFTWKSYVPLLKG